MDNTTDTNKNSMVLSLVLSTTNISNPIEQNIQSFKVDFENWENKTKGTLTITIHCNKQGQS